MEAADRLLVVSLVLPSETYIELILAMGFGGVESTVLSQREQPESMHTSHLIEYLEVLLTSEVTLATELVDTHQVTKPHSIVASHHGA